MKNWLTLQNIPKRYFLVMVEQGENPDPKLIISDPELKFIISDPDTWDQIITDQAGSGTMDQRFTKVCKGVPKFHEGS